MSLATLVEKSYVSPIDPSLLDIYKSYVKRPGWERHKVHGDLAPVVEKAIDLRTLFSLDEVWTLRRDQPLVALAPMFSHSVVFSGRRHHFGFARDTKMTSWGREMKRPYYGIRQLTGDYKVTRVPPMPRQFVPSMRDRIRHRYYVLFEAAWKHEGFLDPYLLRRESEHQFTVVAQWDISEKEQELFKIMGLSE